MTKDEILDLLKKEREYQETVFGDYHLLKSFNVATFLEFIEDYITRAKKSYVGKWTNELPPWLISCRESKEQITAPAETYESLIKIMTLAAAALEIYTDIDVTKWREDGINPKWLDKK